MINSAEPDCLTTSLKSKFSLLFKDPDAAQDFYEKRNSDIIKFNIILLVERILYFLIHFIIFFTPDSVVDGKRLALQ